MVEIRPIAGSFLDEPTPPLGPARGGRAQSADGGGRRARQVRSAGAARGGGRQASPPPGATTAFDSGAVYTELCEFQDFGASAQAHQPAPRRRRARSARTRAVADDGGGRGLSPPPEAINARGAGGYLVGLRNYRDDLNPYLAGRLAVLEKKGGLGGGKGMVGRGAMGKGGGMAAQLLHEQQLRILASLYGQPLRCFGVPPTASPQVGGGLGAAAGAALPAGGGIAAAKAARGGAPATEPADIS